MHLVRAALRAFSVAGCSLKLPCLYLWGHMFLSSVSALFPCLKHPHQKLSFTTTALLDALAALVIPTQTCSPFKASWEQLSHGPEPPWQGEAESTGMAGAEAGLPPLQGLSRGKGDSS